MPHTRPRRSRQGHRRSGAAPDDEIPGDGRVAAAIQPAGDANDSHAQQHAGMLGARQPGGLPWGHAEHQPGERLQNEVLRRIGEHRQEDEQGEQPGLPVLPDIGEAVTEAGRRWALRCFRKSRPALHAPDRKAGDDEGNRPRRRRHRDQARMRVGLQQEAGDDGGHDNAGDHHHPGDGRRRCPPLRCCPGGQQGQQRGAAGADADADQDIGRDCNHEAQRLALFEGQRG